MDQNETDFVVYGGVRVPLWLLLKQGRVNRYGSVEGLSDEELVEPDELERMHLMEELRPVLQLPVRGRKCPIKPSIDEDGRVGCDTFGTMDFEEYRPDVDKPLYKANMLGEERKSVIITILMLRDRIKKASNYGVAWKLLKHARAGTIDVDDIKDWDAWQLAKCEMRVRRLERQIKELREKSKQAKLKKAEAWLKA